MFSATIELEIWKQRKYAWFRAVIDQNPSVQKCMLDLCGSQECISIAELYDEINGCTANVLDIFYQQSCDTGAMTLSPERADQVKSSLARLREYAKREETKLKWRRIFGIVALIGGAVLTAFFLGVATSSMIYMFVGDGGYYGIAYICAFLGIMAGTGGATVGILSSVFGSKILGMFGSETRFLSSAKDTHHLETLINCLALTNTRTENTRYEDTLEFETKPKPSKSKILARILLAVSAIALIAMGVLAVVASCGAALPFVIPSVSVVTVMLSSASGAGFAGLCIQGAIAAICLLYSDSTKREVVGIKGLTQASSSTAILMPVLGSESDSALMPVLSARPATNVVPVANSVSVEFSIVGDKFSLHDSKEVSGGRLATVKSP